jgi:tRNA nucleotidyltransferase/poly(A) polymerase
MVAHGPKVALCAPPRIQEELMRLLRGKRSAHGFRLLQEAGVSPSVLPEMNYLEKRHDKPLLFWDLLQALDTVRKPGEIFDDGLLWSIILLEPLFDMWNSGPTGQDPVREGYEWLNCVGVRLNIPKSVRRQILRMLSDLWVMVNCEEGKRVNKKITRIFSRTDFPNALKLLEIYGIVTKGDNSLLDLWKVRFLQWNKPYKRRRSGRGRRRKRKYSKKEVDNAAAV